jgi:RimJ/RimL family protein N-acetyltransferase
VLPIADPPSFQHGWVALRPVVPADTDWLYTAETHSTLGYRWRFAARTPSPPDYQRALWNGVLCQFAVCERSNGFPAGLVIAFNAEPFNGVCSIALLARPNFIDSGLVTDGMSLLIDYVFRCWNFRKLYGESIEFNYSRFGEPGERGDPSVADLWRIEGTLREHTYYNGQYWDKHIVSIAREKWTEHRDRILARILTHGHQPADVRPEG